MFRGQLHLLYMGRLDVVCVLLNGINAWIDSFLLYPPQNCVLKEHFVLFCGCLHQLEITLHSVAVLDQFYWGGARLGPVIS